MSVFADYAPYYEAFYRDKDYDREAAWVLAALKARGLPSNTLLELGCGQGGHALPFSARGCAVTGIDRSEQMVAAAERHRAALPPEQAERLRFSAGDIRTACTEGTFGAVVSLFHVISYLPGDDDLLAVFRQARARLAPGGLFAFDFWNGPAVLRDPPVPRSREVSVDGARVVRKAEPVMDAARNLVDVNYHFEVFPGDGRAPFAFSETHRMRYLFGPELDLLCARTGFEPLLLCEWLSDPPAPPSTWNAFYLARARA